MGLSMADAINKLDEIQTEAGLRDLINQLDIGRTGETTLLYSGDLNDSTGSGDLVQAMLKNDPDLRALDRTEAAKFLDVKENEAFKQALERIFNSRPSDRGSTANQFLQGSLSADGKTRIPNGAWDIVSKNFVDATPAGSHIVTLTPNADPQRVFAQTELKASLRKDTINNILL